MDWTSTISTTLGALIGVSSTLAVEKLRGKRDRQDKIDSYKRQIYAEYLAALSRTRNELRNAARTSSTPPEERARRAIEAFKEGKAYELRYQVEMLAPAEVVSASDRAFRTLRDLRDVVESGLMRTGEEYQEKRDAWDLAFADLRSCIRDSIEASSGSL